MGRHGRNVVVAGGVVWLGVPDRPRGGETESGPSPLVGSSLPVEILGTFHGPRILELVRTHLADRADRVNPRQGDPHPDPTWRNHR